MDHEQVVLDNQRSDLNNVISGVPQARNCIGSVTFSNLYQ